MALMVCIKSTKRYLAVHYDTGSEWKINKKEAYYGMGGH